MLGTQSLQGKIPRAAQVYQSTSLAHPPLVFGRRADRTQQRLRFMDVETLRLVDADTSERCHDRPGLHPLRDAFCPTQRRESLERGDDNSASEIPMESTDELAIHLYVVT